VTPDAETSPRSKRLWFWLVLAVGLLFWRYLFTNQLPLLPTNDSETCISARTMAMRFLFQGEFPLWNPYILCGVPFFADYPTSILSPFNLTYLVFDLLDAYVVRTMLEFLLAGMGAYVFLRHFLKTRPVAALFGGVVFMLNGYFFWRVKLPTFLSTTAYVPLMFYFYARALEDESWRCAVAAGFVVTLMVFASYWFLPYIVILFPIYHIAAVVANRRGKTTARSVFALKYLFLAGIVDIGLTAVQLLPAVELARHTARRMFHYPAPDLKGLLFLGLGTLFANGWPSFGSIPDLFGWGREGMKTCIGIVPLLLALVGILHRGERRRIPLLVTGIAFTAMYLVSICPGVRLLVLKVLPNFDTMQHSYSLVVYTFTMSVMAGLGCDHLVNGRVERSALLLRLAKVAAWLFLVVVTAALIGIVLIVVCRNTWPAPIARQYIAYAKSAGRMVHAETFYVEKVQHIYNELLAAAPAVIASLTAKLVALCLLLRWLRRTDDRPFPAGALCLTVAVGLIAVGWQYLPYNDRADLYPETEVVRFLQKHEPDTYRMAMKINTIRGGVPDDVHLHLDHFSEITEWADSNTWHLFRSVPMHFGIRKVDGLAGLCLNRFYHFTKRIDPDHVYRAQVTILITGAPLLDLLNMRYLVCSRKQTAKDIQLVCEGAGMFVYEAPHPMPRAFCVAKGIAVAGGEETLRRLATPGFDATKTVLLETTGEIEPGGTERLDWRAAIAESRLNAVTANVEASAACWLVLCDVFYPGWTATVNGVDTPVLPAYHTLRAVRVPEGHSTVVFRYKPLSFTLGAGISLCTVGVLLAVLVGAARFRRRKTHE